MRRAGVNVAFLRFSDGQELLDFLFKQTRETRCDWHHHYLLLLDIRMPKVDGVTALRKIRADSELYNLPVIILTTTDDPREVDLCHDPGCIAYIQKPTTFNAFVTAIAKLGLPISAFLR